MHKSCTHLVVTRAHRYREYNYFIVKHAVAAYDPRGDQVSCLLIPIYVWYPLWPLIMIFCTWDIQQQVSIASHVLQGHNGPHFMTFHRAFLLEYENALLSVVPELKAMPYLDITLDFPGGRW
jgi:hypothetical protein